MPRAEVVDCVRLLGRRATEECGAVHHGIDAAHRGCKRVRIEQVALHDLDAGFAQRGRAAGIAHERTHMVTPQGESFREPASDLAGRSSDQDVHGPQRSPPGSPRIGENGHARAVTGACAARPNNPGMRPNDIPSDPMPRRASPAPCVAALSVHEVGRDTGGTLVPRLQSQIVVRFGPMARGGLDVHAMGVRQRVHRKRVFGGQRIVVARLPLGMDAAILGVPASAIAGQTVAIEDLWDDAACLFDRLACARGMPEAAAALEGAISERLGIVRARCANPRLALEAASRLARDSVDTVAADLGVSTRHLRRVFCEALGMGPKAFARLTRFHYALRDARQGGHGGWAGIAAAAGYYDQAHLIAEFRAIAGVTPRALVDELRAGPGLG